MVLGTSDPLLGSAQLRATLRAGASVRGSGRRGAEHGKMWTQEAVPCWVQTQVPLLTGLGGELCLWASISSSVKWAHRGSARVRHCTSGSGHGSGATGQEEFSKHVVSEAPLW